jgi:hypothetical protein
MFLTKGNNKIPLFFNEIKPNAMEKDVKITLIANGPSMLEGGQIQIVHADGKTETKEGKVFLCRCGHSKDKPYCDGSHKKHEFVG